MLLMKIMFWLMLYPLSVVGFIITSIWDMVLFLFHSPVDIWNIISRAFDNIEAESAE